MISVIAKRELRSLFVSPLAWAILAVLQLLLGYIFLAYVDSYLMNQGRLSAIQGAPGITRLVVSPWINSSALVLMLVVPLITMRLISDEYRAQTMGLLLAAPLSDSQIILGKYLGVLVFLLCLLCTLALMPVSLLMGAALDTGLLASGLLGFALLIASFAALGLYMSTLTSQPTVAAVSTVGVLMFLWIIDWADTDDAQGVGNVVGQLSLARHFYPLTRGVFNSADIVYFGLFILFFLVLSIWRLRSKRRQP